MQGPSLLVASLQLGLRFPHLGGALIVPCGSRAGLRSAKNANTRCIFAGGAVTPLTAVARNGVHALP